VTNHCNRACPWCSTYSSPRGGTWLCVEDYVARLPAHGAFEVQLEGGEPTIHPQFLECVRLAREHPRCTRVVVCTNGVVLPRRRDGLLAWLARVGAPLTVKVSVNHHLLDRDPGLLALCASLRDLVAELGGDRLLVINVRLRRGVEDDDARVLRAVEEAGLLPHANVFFLQRYGLASGETSWEPPFAVADRFTLVNPDGSVHGTDLVGRSDAMGRLP
jgi:MoaA/NifB/PqqE/SkfB family radical SAM enzyme